MRLCGIDFESTGFPATECRITEMGATLCTYADGQIIQNSEEVNSLVWDASYPSQSQEVIDVTGITDEMLKADGKPFHVVLKQLVDMFMWLGWPDFFIAHNKAFDEVLFKAEIQRNLGIISSEFDVSIYTKLLNTPWLCTLKDITHPKKFKSHKLAHLALDYGCPVDPNTLHRSIADVRLMLFMASRGKFDLAKMAALAKVPNVIIRALVPKPFGPQGDNGVGKEKAKACGFGWERPPGCDGPIVKNAWLKQVKENEVEKEKEALGGYEVAIIETR